MATKTAWFDDKTDVPMLAEHARTPRVLHLNEPA